VEILFSQRRSSSRGLKKENTNFRCTRTTPSKTIEMGGQRRKGGDRWGKSVGREWFIQKTQQKIPTDFSPRGSLLLRRPTKSGQGNRKRSKACGGGKAHEPGQHLRGENRRAKARSKIRIQRKEESEPLALAILDNDDGQIIQENKNKVPEGEQKCHSCEELGY